MAWIVAIAFVLYQIPVAVAIGQPMPASSADVQPPCHEMDPGSAEAADAMPDMVMPCCAKAMPGSQKGDTHPCPNMDSGCFSMCATVVPAILAIQAAERLPEPFDFFKAQGTPLPVPPLRRPPRSL
jgi:hypothetical protein